MNNGLNGAFGRWLKGAINKVAGIVDSYLNVVTMGIWSEIGSFQNWSTDIGSGGADFWNRETNYENDPRSFYEPTLSEQSILDRSMNDISEVLKNITEEAIQMRNNTFSIDKTNNVVRRLAVLKVYYQTHENKGLSSSAIELRNLAIEILTQPVVDIILEKISGSGKKITVETITRYWHDENLGYLIELQPLRKTLLFEPLYPYEQYKIKEPLNATSPIVIDPIKGEIPVETNPVEDNPTNTVTTTQTQTNKFSYNWILWGLAGFGLFKAITKK